MAILDISDVSHHISLLYINGKGISITVCKIYADWPLKNVKYTCTNGGGYMCITATTTTKAAVSPIAKKS
jgi:hypothetical protein